MLPLSKKFEHTAYPIPLKASKIGLCFFGVSYFLMLLALSYLGIFWAWRAILLLTLGLDGAYFLWKISGRSPKAIIKIILQNDKIKAINGCQQTEMWHSMQWRQIFPFLIILRYQGKKKTIQSLLIFSDSTTPEIFHYLIVLCRLKRG